MVEVSVGDWLGSCGNFGGRTMLHFEVLSRTELTMAPWDSAAHRFHDGNADAICDLPALDAFVTDRLGDGIDMMDILRGARELRRVKAYHKSEWALANADALSQVIPNTTTRNNLWQTRIRHFMWVADAAAAYTDLPAQLTDAQGLMWHYHPITFMEFINRRVVAENGQVNEPSATNTNVTMEDGYLRRFVSFAGGAAAPAAADNQPLRPYDISDISGSAFEYQFTRADLACRGALPHDPPANPPTETKFHLALLELIENIRRLYNQGIRVNLAHLCAGHNAPAGDVLCVMNNGTSRQRHADGHAVDISPTGANAARCRQLFEAINTARTAHAASCGEHGGEPSRADLPEALCNFQVYAPADILTALGAGTALTAAQVPRCIFHIEVVPQRHSVVWDCVIRPTTTAWNVTLTYVQGRADMVASYATQAEAAAERPTQLHNMIQNGTNWEVSLRMSTRAVAVTVENGRIVASYGNPAEAETEKAPGSPSAWPREITV
jgi:hypothetical protein